MSGKRLGGGRPSRFTTAAGKTCAVGCEDRCEDGGPVGSKVEPPVGGLCAELDGFGVCARCSVVVEEFPVFGAPERDAIDDFTLHRVFADRVQRGVAANFSVALNRMEDEVTFSPEMREYWSSHSGLLETLLNEPDFETEEEKNYNKYYTWTTLPRDFFPGFTDNQFRIFKQLVEGGSDIFWFSKDGTAFLNTSYGIKPKELKHILDYLLYTHPTTMKADLATFAREYRLAKPGTPVGLRQTDAIRVRAGAARTRRLRQEARKAGMLVRNYMEFLQERREEQEELKKQRRRATARAAKQFKKRGLGVSLNSTEYRNRTAKRGKAKWGEKRGFGPRRHKPSRPQNNSNETGENLNEEEVIENAEVNNGDD